MDTDTHTNARRMPGKDEGREQGEAQCKDCHRLPANPQKLGHGHGTDCLSQSADGTNSMALMFQPPEKRQ